jgi:hypothetical protein
LQIPALNRAQQTRKHGKPGKSANNQYCEGDNSRSFAAG